MIKWFEIFSIEQQTCCERTYICKHMGILGALNWLYLLPIGQYICTLGTTELMIRILLPETICKNPSGETLYLSPLPFQLRCDLMSDIVQCLGLRSIYEWERWCVCVRLRMKVCVYILPGGACAITVTVATSTGENNKYNQNANVCQLSCSLFHSLFFHSVRCGIFQLRRYYINSNFELNKMQNKH